MVEKHGKGKSTPRKLWNLLSGRTGWEILLFPMNTRKPHLSCLANAPRVGHGLPLGRRKIKLWTSFLGFQGVTDIISITSGVVCFLFFFSDPLVFFLPRKCVCWDPLVMFFLVCVASFPPRVFFGILWFCMVLRRKSKSKPPSG